MTVATVMPFVPAQWFTSAGDAVLSGGQLWFYEVGTSTPKEVYSDYEATTPHAQPVILSASGKATVFLGAGGYKVVLKDALGAVMDTVDGVFGDPGTANGGFLQTGIATFADLRAFSNPGEAVTVLVAGALAQGDGGGGLFTFNPAITTADDGGIIIAPDFGIGRWVRSVSGTPSISWWGIKGLTTESDDAAIANAFAYCNAQNCSLIVDRHNVGLRSNATFSGSELIFSGGDFYTAGSPAVLTMSTGARVKADPHDQIIAGGGTLRYGAGQIFSPEWTSPALTDAGLAIAIAAAGVSPCRMEISNPYTCSASVTIPGTIELGFSEDGRIDFTGTASLSIGRMDYVGRSQVFSWDSIAHVGAVSINAPEIFPEWFGATGNGITDDSIAFYAAAKTGRVNLANAGNYLLGPLWSATPTPLTIKGGTVTLGAGKTLGNGILALDATKISGSGAGWFTGTAFQAFDSEFSTVPSVASSSISGCKVGTMFPFYAGTKPTIWGAYTDIPGAQILGTSAAGKIEDRGSNLNLTNASISKLSLAGLTFPGDGTPISGVYALGQPLALVYIVNDAIATEITLPSVNSFDDPRFVIFIPLTNSTYVIKGAIRLSGGIVSSMPCHYPIMFYLNQPTGVWCALKFVF